MRKTDIQTIGSGYLFLLFPLAKIRPPLTCIIIQLQNIHWCIAIIRVDTIAFQTAMGNIAMGINQSLFFIIILMNNAFCRSEDMWIVITILLT